MLRRTLIGIIGGVASIVVVSIIVFVIVRLTGDPARIMAPPDATTAQLAAIRKSLGLNESLPLQYWHFATNAARGNLGNSIEYQVPVLHLYSSRLPQTLELAGVAFGIALLFGIVLGLYAAHRPNSPIDYLTRFLAALGQAVPQFVVGLLLILILSVRYHVFPSYGNSSWKSVVLPAVTLALASAASLMRLTRSSTLEVLTRDYITLARLKGIREATILWRHALRNSILPVLTFGALIFINMLSGAIIVETVFNWPGIGLLMVDGIQARDFPVVQGGVLLFAGLYVFVNVLVDILYVVLNPALRSAVEA